MSGQIKIIRMLWAAGCLMAVLQACNENSPPYAPIFHVRSWEGDPLVLADSGRYAEPGAVLAVDLDLDSDLDVAAVGPARCLWFENLGGKPARFVLHPIDSQGCANAVLALDMNEDHVADLINISRDMVSLDTPIYDEKDSSILSDFVEDKGQKAPEESVIDRSLREDINAVLSTLSGKEADIIQYRFGLNGKRPMSLKEIGNRYKLTKERIRQIEKKALKRLQHPSRGHSLRSYMA